MGVHKDNKVALKRRTARKIAQVALGLATGLTMLAAIALVVVSLALFITTGNPQPMPLIIASITAISTAVVSSTAVGIHTPFWLNERRNEKLENEGIGGALTGIASAVVGGLVQSGLANSTDTLPFLSLTMKSMHFAVASGGVAVGAIVAVCAVILIITAIDYAANK